MGKPLGDGKLWENIDNQYTYKVQNVTTKGFAVELSVPCCFKFHVPKIPYGLNLNEKRTIYSRDVIFRCFCEEMTCYIEVRLMSPALCEGSVDHSIYSRDES